MHASGDKHRILTDVFFALDGQSAFCLGECISAGHLPMNSTYLPLKCRQFRCLAVIMQYAMTASYNLYQQSDYLGVRYEFWWSEL